ncbi:MAG: Clp protease N-terminal domain-containing protein [Candidatus Dormibacteria bacterium]|jgi:ATP-dependent Clp protease ATP-binding subunit ClpA
MYPFEHFTEAAKKALTLTQEEAEASRHSYIGTEHLLIGLLREGEGLAARALTNLGMGIGGLRRGIASVLGENEPTVTRGIAPTARVKRVVELSFTEARRTGTIHVGTDHLLLGLLLEGEGIAAHVLHDLGADLEAVRAELARVAATGIREEFIAEAPRSFRDGLGSLREAVEILGAPGLAAPTPPERAELGRLTAELTEVERRWRAGGEPTAEGPGPGEAEP